MKPGALRAMLALGLALGAVDPALAQDGTRTIRGTVVDSANHQPISQAEIYLGRARTGERTAKDGTFRVSAAQGPVILMVRRPGYVPRLIPIPGDRSGAETDLGTTSLRQVKTDADRAAVQAADVQAYPELARFYDHKAKHPQGLFFSPDDLQRASGTLVPLIRQRHNYRFICFATRKGELDCGQELSRGPTSIMRGNPPSAQQEPCPLEIWSNGAEPFRQTLDNILVDDVLAVEAYHNPGITPSEYQGSPCAALILYMRETDTGAPVR